MRPLFFNLIWSPWCAVNPKIPKILPLKKNPSINLLSHVNSKKKKVSDSFCFINNTPLAWRNLLKFAAKPRILTYKRKCETNSDFKDLEPSSRVAVKISCIRELCLPIFWSHSQTQVAWLLSIKFRRNLHQCLYLSQYCVEAKLWTKVSRSSRVHKGAQKCFEFPIIRVHNFFFNSCD